jgi:hypothetical protein
LTAGQLSGGNSAQAVATVAGGMITGVSMRENTALAFLYPHLVADMQVGTGLIWTCPTSAQVAKDASGYTLCTSYAAGINAWMAAKGVSSLLIWGDTTSAIGNITAGGSKTTQISMDICAAAGINGGTCP